MASVISYSPPQTITLPFSSHSVVLVGGCFDLLHDGHRAFLHKAKEQGEKLIVLLESDAMIKLRKGDDRPVQTQQKRAENLTALPIIDVIILLPTQMNNQDYDKLVSDLKPAIIATTKGDPGRHHKERTGNLSGAKVIDVIERLPQHSTTKTLDTYVN